MLKLSQFDYNCLCFFISSIRRRRRIRRREEEEKKNKIRTLLLFFSSFSPSSFSYFFFFFLSFFSSSSSSSSSFSSKFLFFHFADLLHGSHAFMEWCFFTCSLVVWCSCLTLVFGDYYVFGSLLCVWITWWYVFVMYLIFIMCLDHLMICDMC